MRYVPVALSFKARTLPDASTIGISSSGDYAFLSEDDLAALKGCPESISLERRAALQARFFLGTSGNREGSRRLEQSRRAAKRETMQSGPSLHIIVPTLVCAHSCQYCQVSRALSDVGHTISLADLEAACDSVFQSPSKALTIEFQGGDPLLRFDLVRHAILRVVKRNEAEQRQLRFVIASTLHQLDEDMCAFFRMHKVYLSTSLDGPEPLHNANRPIPTKDSHARSIKGIELARQELGHNFVAALMTTTRRSLKNPEAIVDEYVRLGFREIFLRPLSAYGFAKRNQALLGYSLREFQDFYARGLQRVMHWNREGVEIREVYAGIILNKMLSTFDSGYVDLQSPTGAGTSVLAYNYDGYVYPSDEARMLAESGDTSLRLGRIGQPLEELLASPIQGALTQASTVENMPGCVDCAYNQFCAPNPVDAQAQYGNPFAAVETTEHCQRHLWLFDSFSMRLRTADTWTLNLFHRWAESPQGSVQ